jgi:hypothetical protein
MSKQMKREVFMACLVRVSRGILPIGSFKAVAEQFQIDPKTIGKLWKSTMTQVNGYQPNEKGSAYGVSCAGVTRNFAYW